MKKYSAVIAIFLVLALAVPVFANPFTDVPANHWAYSAVNKLVASGIAEGYPDGSFRGKNNLTRYEIAIVVSRILDKIEMEREMLADDIDTAAKSLSKEEAQDVTAIVKAMLAKNQPGTGGPAPTNLTDQQVEEVVNLIEALTFEFKAELKILGQKIDGIYADVDAVEARVAALEAGPTVSFSGSYEVDFEHQTAEGDGIVDDDTELNYYWLDEADIADVNTFIKNHLAGNEDADFDDAVDAYNASASVIADPTLEIKKDEDGIDDYVEVPWTDDEITVNQDKEFTQTLTFKTNINKGGFAAVLDIDATDDDDELDIDSIGITLENEDVKGTYNEANSVAFADYAYNDKEIDGVTVDFKKYGLNTFFGIKEVSSGVAKDTQEKTVPHPDYPTWDVEIDKEVIQYEEDDDQLVAMKDTVDYYAYGVSKTFSLGGLDLAAKLAGERDVADEEVMTNIFGLATGTEVAGLGVNFDMAFSMDAKADTNGSLLRLGVSNDLDIAKLEFNYKNSGEDFKALNSDDTIFDTDDDDYDLYTTGVKAGTSGWNLTVSPNIIEDLEASVFYASVNDGADNTKMALNGKMPVLIEGLTVNGKYETTDEDGDKTNTMGFGAEYTLLADKATATFDYTTVDPVEDEADEPTVKADKSENTMELGLDYTLNDYVAANFSYQTVSNLGYVDKFAGKDISKTATTFGADLTDYPVFGDLTVSAGFGYEMIEGYEFVDHDPTAVNPKDDPADWDSLEETATKLSMGLGYTLGVADLSYELTNTNKEGEGVDDGTYTTHEFGLTYPVVEGTDFVAAYKIYDFESDEIDGFDVQTATAGVSISF